MARRTLYHSPITGDRPTESQLIRDDLAPDPRVGMVPCPRGCKIRFHYAGSIAWDQHMTTVHPGEVRNVVLVGGRRTGKSTTADAWLHATGHECGPRCANGNHYDHPGNGAVS
jgi:hypothetical protein